MYDDEDDLNRDDTIKLSFGRAGHGARHALVGTVADPTSNAQEILNFQRLDLMVFTS